MRRNEFIGGEGGGATSAAGRWIVDPIDGTGNYVKDIPLYTVSIAYELHGRLEIGCVYAPALDEMYLAVRGGGAFCNGKPIHASIVSLHPARRPFSPCPLPPVCRRSTTTCCGC